MFKSRNSELCLPKTSPTFAFVAFAIVRKSVGIAEI